MNVETYLSEMRAAGYRLYVTQHPANKGNGVLTLFPDKAVSDKTQSRILELEAWRRANVSRDQLVGAILASEFNIAAQKETNNENPN